MSSKNRSPRLADAKQRSGQPRRRRDSKPKSTRAALASRVLRSASANALAERRRSPGIEVYEIAKRRDCPDAPRWSGTARQGIG